MWTTLVILQLCAGAAAGAAVDTPGGLLPLAHRQIDDAQFQAARRTLERALRDLDNSAPTQVELYRLLGIVDVYLDDRVGAEAAFTQLLHIDPRYALPKGTAPNVRAIFDRVQIQLSAEPRVGLRVEAPPEIVAGHAATFTVDLSGMERGFHAYLYYRRPGEAEYRFEELRGPLLQGKGRFPVRIAGLALPPQAGGRAIEYYAEVLDGGGRRVAAEGDAHDPRRVEVRDEPVAGAAARPQQAEAQAPAPASQASASESSPWYKKWWVWTLVGAVVVGAGATTYALVPKQPPSGTVPVTVVVPP